LVFINDSLASQGVRRAHKRHVSRGFGNQHYAANQSGFAPEKAGDCIRASLHEQVMRKVEKIKQIHAD
jgi:hypothetical protein